MADDPGALLHEYSHWVLDGLARSTRDSWSEDIKAVESGLAYYLPCSFLGSPSITGLNLTAARYDPPWLGLEHQNGLRWAGALWDLRGQWDQQVMDPAVFDAWRSALTPIWIGPNSPVASASCSTSPSDRRLGRGSRWHSFAPECWTPSHSLAFAPLPSKAAIDENDARDGGCMKALAIYTGLRLLLFAVVLVLLSLVGARGCCSRCPY